MEIEDSDILLRAIEQIDEDSNAMIRVEQNEIVRIGVALTIKQRIHTDRLIINQTHVNEIGRKFFQNCQEIVRGNRIEIALQHIAQRMLLQTRIPKYIRNLKNITNSLRFKIPFHPIAYTRLMIDCACEGIVGESCCAGWLCAKCSRSCCSSKSNAGLSLVDEAVAFVPEAIDGRFC